MRVNDGTIHRDRQDLIVMPGPQESDSNGEHSSEEDDQEQWCGQVRYTKDGDLEKKR